METRDSAPGFMASMVKGPQPDSKLNENRDVSIPRLQSLVPGTQ